MSDWQHLDQLLAEATGGGFPAIVLHIRQHGEVLYEKAVGWPTQPDTYFDLASLTKLFTATAFLRLVASGKVNLDWRVAQVLPEFASFRPIRPYEDPLHPGEWIVISGEWAMSTSLVESEEGGMGLVDADAVTFRHLLTHSSGLPAWRPLYRQPANAIREMVFNTFFSYPTSATVVYSDLGFILLGWAIEQLTGQPLDQAITQLVLTPLNLSAIRFRPLPTTDSNSQFTIHNSQFTINETMNNEQCAPTEYCRWRKRRLQGEVHDENTWAMGGIAGHAGLFGSAAAVAALGQTWLDALNGTSDFLAQALAQEATSPQAEAGMVRRGLGWALWSADPAAASHPLSTQSFGHTGFTGTSLYIDPERQLVIACLTNEVYLGRQNRTIAPFRLALHNLVVRLLRK